MTIYPYRVHAEGLHQQRGSVLLAIVILLTLIGASSYWLVLAGSQSLQAGASGAEVDAVRELRNAAIAHGLTLAADGSCPANASVANVAIGDHSYSFQLKAAANSNSQTFTPTHDSYIKEDKANETNATHKDLHSQLQEGKDRHGLMRFDTSAIPPGSIVQSATLWLYIHEEDPNWPVAVHENTESFEESNVTWSNFAQKYDKNPVAYIAPSPEKFHWVRVPLTSVAQRWINNPLGNFGVRFVSTEEGTESKLSSREYDDAAERPYLQVTLATQRNTTAELRVTPTLGTGRTLPQTTQQIELLQADQTLVLQPGSESQDAWYDSDNHDEDVLQITSSGRYGALRFQIHQVPKGAKILSAHLRLTPTTTGSSGEISAQAFTAIWDESRVTESTARLFDPWARTGGEVDNWLVHRARFDTGEPQLIIPVTETVQRWSDGAANFGFRLSTTDATARFASSDHTTASSRPELVIRFTCGCGLSCELGASNNYEMLFIVDNSLVPSAQERLRLDTFRAWGYNVSVVSDGTFGFTSSSSLSGKDVVYISSEITDSSIGSLATTSVGVVSENILAMDDLGVSQTTQNQSAATITIDSLNASITSAFAAGDVSVAAKPIALISHNNPAPGAEAIASIGGRPGVLTLSAGAVSTNGANAASNRVGLPFGSGVDWAQLSGDALLLIRESLKWASVGSETVSFCDADYSPSVVERSIFTGGDSLDDVTWVPEGAELAGVTAPPGGAWLVTDSGAEVFRMLAGDGTLLATLDAPTNDPAGITYIESGAQAGHWAYVDWWNERLVIMDQSGSVITTYDTAVNGLITTSGISFIGPTPDGQYDDHLVVVDEYTGRVEFYNQAGAIQHSLTVIDSENPRGIEHLPGSNKLLITYPNKRRIVDFSGSDLRSNTAGQPASGSGTGIDGESCQHVLADASNRTLKFLKSEVVPAAAWDFDEGAGTTVFDEVSEREGTLTATNWATTGISGAALAFNGTSSQISVAQDAELARDRNLSISAWAYPESLSGRQGIISNDTYYQLGLLDDQIYFRAQGSTIQEFVSSGAPIALNEWSNIGATVDSAGKVTLYVNGAVVGGGSLTEASNSSSNDLLIGTDHADNSFNGVLDDIRLYNDVLSLSEVVAAYDNNAPLGASNPFCEAARDDFETQDWQGSTGNLPWSGSWIEINEATDPTSGDIVVGKPFGWVARLRDNDGGGEGIERALNLSGYGNATLTLEYWRASLESNDYITALYSRDDGETWIELQRINGPGTDPVFNPGIELSMSLPPPLTAQTRIRFITWSGMGSNDRVYLDNIAVTACE